MIFFKNNITPLICSLLLVGLLLAGCETEWVDADTPTYVRVMDMRNFSRNEVNLDVARPFFSSVFRWDGHYYGNPDFDNVTPQQTIDEYGDFLLGRVALNSYLVESGGTIRTLTFSFTGLLDYYTSPSNTNSYVLYQPYLQGANEGNGANLESAGRNVCFPNLSHRVPVAPIINDIDYFKWAKLAAGSHTVGFAKAETTFTIGQQSVIEIPSSRILDRPYLTDEPYYFQPNGIYSLLLVSESTTDLDKVRLLRVQEDEQFVPDPNKAYIRFINAIPFTNSSADNDTESLDFYVRQLDNGELNSKAEGDTIRFDTRFLQSTTPERLVISDLKRFGQNGLLPYVEMDFSEYLSRGDTTANGVKQSGVPSFVFYAYRHGESEATGGRSLTKYQYVLSNVKGNWVGATFDFDGLGSSSTYILPNIPVLAQTANGYVPTINTVVLGTEQLYEANGTIQFEIFSMGYSLERTAVRQSFLNSTDRGD